MYLEKLLELVFLIQEQKHPEKNEIASGLDELDRQSVNVINGRIERIVMDGNTEFALHAKAAAA